MVSERFSLCKTFRKSWSKYKWNALRRWKCSGKSRSSLTSRSGPTESCHSFFKHFRVQFYMTDREVINIKFQSKRLVLDASVRLEILFLSSNVFLFSLELLPVVSDMFVWSRGKSTLRLCHCERHPISAIYYKQRILHGRAEIRNFSSGVEKYFTSERSERVKYLFNTRREISYLQGAM